MLKYFLFVLIVAIIQLVAPRHQPRLSPNLGDKHLQPPPELTSWRRRISCTAGRPCRPAAPSGWTAQTGQTSANPLGIGSVNSSGGFKVSKLGVGVGISVIFNVSVSVLPANFPVSSWTEFNGKRCKSSTAISGLIIGTFQSSCFQVKFIASFLLYLLLVPSSYHWWDPAVPVKRGPANDWTVVATSSSSASSSSSSRSSPSCPHSSSPPSLSSLDLQGRD